jgi:putative ABC transport system permease protein
MLTVEQTHAHGRVVPLASRTVKLGIRMALGVTPRQLHREVLRHAARLVGGGVAIGTASLLMTPALATFLAGLRPADPIAFVAAAVLMLVAFVVSHVPARRLARVDPLLALRK